MDLSLKHPQACVAASASCWRLPCWNELWTLILIQNCSSRRPAHSSEIVVLARSKIRMQGYILPLKYKQGVFSSINVLIFTCPSVLSRNRDRWLTFVMHASLVAESLSDQLSYSRHTGQAVTCLGRTHLAFSSISSRLKKPSSPLLAGRAISRLCALRTERQRFDHRYSKTIFHILNIWKPADGYDTASLEISTPIVVHRACAKQYMRARISALITFMIWQLDLVIVEWESVNWQAGQIRCFYASFWT